MENKLVFEPTILTQYNWNKYVLNETRTYYWDKYEAEPDYLYNYYWNKYEVVPPQLTNQWDTYNFNYTFDYEYDENLILQNIQSKDWYNWQQTRYQTNQFIRVLRNDTVLTNEFGDYPGSAIDNYPTHRVELVKQVKGAYLFLIPRVSGTGWVTTSNYGSNIKQYLAKSLKDITQMTNLIRVTEDIIFDGNGNARTYEEINSILKSLILEDGYKYAFCSKEQIYPSTWTLQHSYYCYGRYSAYENGLIYGDSERVNYDLYLEYKREQEAQGLSVYYQGPYLASSANASNSIMTLQGQYTEPNVYLDTDCLFNDVGMSLGTDGYYETEEIENISVIQILTPTTQIQYGSHFVSDTNGIWANLVMSHELNFRQFRGNNPNEGNVGIMNGGLPYDADDLYAVSGTVSAFTSQRPGLGTFNSYAYNTNINTYPQTGIYNNKWYIYKGEVALDDYSPGEMIQENVMSHFADEYPQDGIQDDYYYVYQYWTRTVVDWLRGRYIGLTTSSSYEYPQDGVVPNDLSDTTHYWYSFIRYVSHYTKGDYIEKVKSYIESAYPRNSYIIGDSWYVFQNSQQVLVGELVIDETKLMGGVNYTQEINPSEDLMIGSSGAAQVDFTIYAPDADAATQYLGKDFTYFVKMNSDTDWRQIGLFTLTTAELPDKQTAKIEGFDYIYKFDVIVDEWLDSLTFPMTLGNFFKSLCEYVGCEAYTIDFNNSSFQVNDNFEAVQITGRTILQYITEVSGGFCVAEPDGKIHIKQYSYPPVENINLGNDSYVKYTHEIYNVPVITSVVVRKDDDDEGVESNV